MKATKEQIQEWKEKYGEIFHMSVGGKNCYLKKPDRATLSASMTYEKQDPLKADEVLLVNCWIDGDEEIKTDLDLFLSIRPQLAGLFNVKQAKLVKL